MSNAEYKEFLITGILEFQHTCKFTRAELEKKDIRTLERIFDNVC